MQGVGAALLSPAALAIITTTFHGSERNRALGVWAAIGGTGAAAGVLLSGLLTAGPGWQWVFYFNVPVGAVVLTLIPGLVRADAASAARQRVDVPGAVLVTASTALLIYSLVHAGDAGWSASATLGALVAAVVGYGLFVVAESRAATPLMRPKTLTRRPVVSGTFLMLVVTGLMLGLFFLTSLYLQHVLGVGQRGGRGASRVPARRIRDRTRVRRGHDHNARKRAIRGGGGRLRCGEHIPRARRQHRRRGRIDDRRREHLRHHRHRDHRHRRLHQRLLACAVIAGAAAVVALVPAGRPHAVAGHGHGVGHGH